MYTLKVFYILTKYITNLRGTEMKRLFSILLCLGMLLSLWACGNSKTKSEEKSKTPIEDLNEDEKYVFDALVVAGNSFFNPSEMRLLDIGDPGLDDARHATVTVRLQGENKLGGTVNDYYRLTLYRLRGKELAKALAEEAFENDYYRDNWNECKAGKYPRSWYDTIDEYKKYITEEYWKDYYFHSADERDEYIESEAKNDWDTSADDEYPRSSYDSYNKYLSFCKKYYKTQYFVVQNYDKEISPKKDESFGLCESIENATIEVSGEGTYDVAKINRALKYHWDKKLGNIE